MKNKTTPSNVEGLDFQDAVAYAKREAATLKAEGCDVVIALSHTLDPKNDGCTGGRCRFVAVWT